MPTIEATLKTLLGNLVSGRSYALVNDSATIVLPYITFQVVAAVPLTVHGGEEKKRVQIDVFAATYDEAKTLAESVKTAMNGATFVSSFIAQQDLYEEVSKEHRELLEFYIWP